MIVLFTIFAILIALFLLFLLIVSPSDRNHKNIGLLKGAYIAHRGLHDDNKTIPENSLLAYKKAIEKGFPIEIDVHLTADGEVAVFHDHTLDRMCKKEGKVEEMTIAELKKANLAGTDEKIPTLKEVLDLVNGKVFLLIEFKAKNNAKALCKAAEKVLSDYKGAYFIQSFYPQVLHWYKWHKRGVCRGLLGAKFPERKFIDRLPGKMLLNFLGRPDFIAFKHEDSDAIFRRFVVWLGAESLGWTFRSQKDLDEKKECFHGYIFENFLPNGK